MTNEKYTDPHKEGPYSQALGRLFLDKDTQRRNNERTSLTDAIEWYSKEYYRTETEKREE